MGERVSLNVHPLRLHQGRYLVEGSQQPRGLTGEAEALLHRGDGALEVAGDHELCELQEAVAQDEELPGGPRQGQRREGQRDRWGFSQRGWWLGDRDGVGEREEQGIEMGKQSQRRQIHRREREESQE